ncbi:CRTAC1 family protein [Acidicapsa ligni]|uniref:CRTAC1 family protein n=1 Tax=Acidicapsa ligni TaxID=542300 RepID=UPI0021E08170|nr:CRTAC1 family protein [Acidicapsa ligni]
MSQSKPVLRRHPVFRALYIALAGILFLTAASSAQTAGAGSQQAPAQPKNLPELVDITASTGINFDHLSSPDQRYIVESMGGGVAILDYDQDGWPDLYFTNAQSVDMALAGKKARSVLYHNNHDGTFTDVTDKAGVGYPCWGMGASVGDYNNDAWPDLLVTCFGGVVLYKNNGDGTFTDVTKAAGLGSDKAWATGAVFGDYDGDGWSDLFVSHYVDLNLGDLPKFGSSKTCKYHEIEVQCGPRGLKGSPDNLYRNNHDGTFTDVSKQAGVDDDKRFFGLTAVWSDFNQDGRLDLFVANDSEPNYLYRNDGNGHFTDVAYQAGVAVSQDGQEQANMGVALGDYEHTGRFSIAVTHFSDEYAALFRNDGAMNFTDVSYEAGIAHSTSSYVGWGDVFFDFDNDGWSDFFMVNGHVYPQVDTSDVGTRYREPKLLFLNQHNGKFADISKQAGPALQTPSVSRGVAMGDLFNDGVIDLVIENLQGNGIVLKPKGTSNHWISFELAGTQKNRLALNARVRVTAAGMVQTGEILSGGSYLSQNDLRLHFGLGAADHADKVEILWSDGTTETLANLACDHHYYVLQGKGIVPAEQNRPKLIKRP